MITSTKWERHLRVDSFIFKNFETQVSKNMKPLQLGTRKMTLNSDNWGADTKMYNFITCFQNPKEQRDRDL